MSNSSSIQVGIDVSKPTIDCFFTNQFHCLPNTTAGLRKLCSLLPAHSHVILEATGGYEHKLVRHLQEHSIPVSIVNPQRVRSFAKAKGWLAKTDRIDARVLADYGLAMNPRPTPAAHPTRQSLAELGALRDQLTAIHTQLLNHSEHLELPITRSLLKATLATLRRKIKTLEAATQKQIHGGRPKVRRALYMASLSAIRTGPLKSFYLRLRSNGKPPKVALIASARKLLILLNSSLKSSLPIST